MSTRTYRVPVRGVFDGLDDARRAHLRERAAALSAFSHRVVLRMEPAPARRTTPTPPGS